MLSPSTEKVEFKCQKRHILSTFLWWNEHWKHRNLEKLGQLSDDTQAEPISGKLEVKNCYPVLSSVFHICAAWNIIPLSQQWKTKQKKTENGNPAKEV